MTLNKIENVPFLIDFTFQTDKTNRRRIISETIKYSEGGKQASMIEFIGGKAIREKKISKTNKDHLLR